MHIKDRRIGKIKISGAFVTQYVETVAEILKMISFVSYKAEFLYYSDAFEHIGFSPLFEETYEGNIPPEYDVLISSKFDEEQQKNVLDKVEVKKISSIADYSNNSIAHPNLELWEKSNNNKR